jgi:hypothetical protein
MWSLPDIQVMNAKAAIEADTYRKQVETLTGYDGKPATCKMCSKPAESGHLWYDIFSDDPKGTLFLCEHCDDNCGESPEGYFTCQQCGKRFIENYTWEKYSAHVKDVGDLCLNCYRYEMLSECRIGVKAARKLDAGAAFNLIRSKAKHLLAVGQAVPDDLEFVCNCEFGSLPIEQISGDKLTDVFARLPLDKPVYVILDGAYQFAVSIGFYTGRK